MDILRAQVVFRERNLLDVLDLSLRFLVAHARAYAIVGAAVLLPSIAVTYGAEALWGWEAAWAVGIVLVFSASIPFTVLASRLVFQTSVSAGAVLSSSIRDVPKVMFARFLWAIIFGLSALVIVPAVWTGAAYLFLDEVLVLERATLRGSFGRAQRVATAQFGDAFLAAFFLALAVFVSVAFVDYGGRAVIEELLQFRPPRSMWAEGGSVLALFGLFLAVPFVATARFFTYLNVRTRTEGWDIQIRFSALATRTQAELT